MELEVKQEIVLVDPFAINIPDTRARSALAAEFERFQERRLMGEEAKLLESAKAFLETVRTEGVKEPIILFREGDALWLGHGESSVRASQILRLEKIPALIERGGKKDAMLLSLTTSLQGPTDRMSLVYTLKELSEKEKISYRELGRRYGCSHMQIKRLLTVTIVTPHIQDLFGRGKLSLYHVLQLARIKDGSVANTLADYVVRQEMTWEQLKEFMDVMELIVKEGATWFDAYQQMWDERRVQISGRNFCDLCFQPKEEGGKLTLRRFHPQCWEKVKELRKKLKKT